MNIKKISLIILLSTALFACHTSIFPMEKNQSLARIKFVAPKYGYQDNAYDCRLSYLSSPLYGIPFGFKAFVIDYIPSDLRGKLTLGSWVIVENFSPKKGEIYWKEWSQEQKEEIRRSIKRGIKLFTKIVKIIRPNFKKREIYRGTVRVLDFYDNSILVSVKQGNIPYPFVCSLKKGININDLIPDKTDVEIKITKAEMESPHDDYLPQGEIIKIIGTLPKLKKEQEKEAEIERGEFVAEEVLPQKEVETKKIKLEGKTIHVPPYLLKKGEK